MRLRAVLLNRKRLDVLCSKRNGIDQLWVVFYSENVQGVFSFRPGRARQPIFLLTGAASDLAVS